MKHKVIRSIKKLALMVILVIFWAWSGVEFWNTFASYFAPSLADAKFVHGLAFIGLINIVYFSRGIIGVIIKEKETKE